jgi:hypothetical protein
MYINEKGEEVDFQDKESGLFIKKADTYEVMKFPIPKDCLAV